MYPIIQRSNGFLQGVLLYIKNFRLKITCIQSSKYPTIFLKVGISNDQLLLLGLKCIQSSKYLIIFWRSIIGCNVFAPRNNLYPIIQKSNHNLKESNLNLHLEITCIQLSKHPVDINELAFKLMNYPFQKFNVSNHPSIQWLFFEKHHWKYWILS